MPTVTSFQLLKRKGLLFRAYSDYKIELKKASGEPYSSFYLNKTPNKCTFIDLTKNECNVVPAIKFPINSNSKVTVIELEGDYLLISIRLYSDRHHFGIWADKGDPIAFYEISTSIDGPVLVSDNCLAFRGQELCGKSTPGIYRVTWHNEPSTLANKPVLIFDDYFAFPGKGLYGKSTPGIYRTTSRSSSIELEEKKPKGALTIKNPAGTLEIESFFKEKIFSHSNKLIGLTNDCLLVLHQGKDESAWLVRDLNTPKPSTFLLNLRVDEIRDAVALTPSNVAFLISREWEDDDWYDYNHTRQEIQIWNIKQNSLIDSINLEANVARDSEYLYAQHLMTRSGMLQNNITILGKFNMHLNFPPNKQAFFKVKSEEDDESPGSVIVGEYKFLMTIDPGIKDIFTKDFFTPQLFETNDNDFLAAVLPDGLLAIIPDQTTGDICFVSKEVEAHQAELASRVHETTDLAKDQVNIIVDHLGFFKRSTTIKLLEHKEPKDFYLHQMRQKP